MRPSKLQSLQRKLPARNNKRQFFRNFCEPTTLLRSIPSRVVPRRLTTSKDRSRSRFSFDLPNHFATDKAYPARAQIFSQIDLGSSRRLPELHRLVTRTRGQGLSIRTPGHAPNGVSVPLKLASNLPVAASQSFTVWSSEAEARVFPSGLQATL